MQQLTYANVTVQVRYTRPFRMGHSADYPHSTVSCNNRRGKMWRRRDHVVFRISQSHAFRTSIPHFAFRIPQFRILMGPVLTLLLGYTRHSPDPNARTQEVLS